MNKEIGFDVSRVKSKGKETSVLFENVFCHQLIFDFKRVSCVWMKIKYQVSCPVRLKIIYGPVKDCMKFETEITLLPGKNIFHNKTYIACRYLKIERADCAENEKECRIDKFQFIASQYLSAIKGDFHCNDEEMNSIFSIGAYTNALCAQQNEQAYIAQEKILSKESLDFRDHWVASSGSNYVFFDGPRRDREAWLGDLRTQALISYTALGWNEIVKNSLELFHTLQTKEGYTFGSGTSNQQFVEYNLWWIVAVWEYYLYSGDFEYIQKWYPSMIKLLDYLYKLQNEDGFVHGDACWMWTFPREGYGSALQCILYQAFCKASEISNAVGDTEKSKELSEYAKRLKKNINRSFWNEEKGIYNDFVGFDGNSIPVFQDVNCYAVAFDIAPQNRKSRILHYLKENMWTEYGSTTTDIEISDAVLNNDLKNYPLKSIIESSDCPQKMLQSIIYAHNKQVWPFMNGYEVQARFLAGDESGAIELIRNCWGNRAYKETGTFWEMYDIKTNRFAARKISEFYEGDSYNSACHGWSGWVAYLIQTYILGVSPTKPGYKQTVVRPHPGNITELKGSVPTPYGKISVFMKLADKKWTVEIEHPDTVEVKLITDSPSFKEKEIELKLLKKKQI